MKRILIQNPKLKIQFSRTVPKKIYLVREIYPKEKLEIEIEKREKELIENATNPDFKSMKELIVLLIEKEELEEAKKWFEYLSKNDNSQAVELFKFLFKIKEQNLEREEIKLFILGLRGFSKSSQYSLCLVYFLIARHFVYDFDYLLAGDFLVKINTIIENDKTLLEEPLIKSIYPPVLDALSYMSLKNKEEKFAQYNQKCIDYKKELGETKDDLYASSLLHKAEHYVLSQDLPKASIESREPISLLSSLIKTQKSPFLSLAYIKGKIIEITLIQLNQFSLQRYNQLCKSALEFATQNYNEKITDYSIANLILVYQLQCVFDLQFNDFENFEKHNEKASFHIKQMDNKKIQFVFIVKRFELLQTYFGIKENKEALYETLEEYIDYLNTSTLELNLNFVKSTIKNYIKSGTKLKKFKKVPQKLKEFETNLKIEMLIFYVEELHSLDYDQESYEVLKSLQKERLKLEDKQKIRELMKKTTDKLKIDDQDSEDSKCIIS